MIVCYTNLLISLLATVCCLSLSVQHFVGTIIQCMSSLSCDIFMLIFIYHIIHFYVSLQILDWTLSTLYFDRSFVDQYIESSDIEQMILFLFDPHILLFVIFSSFCLFKYYCKFGNFREIFISRIFDF